MSHPFARRAFKQSGPAPAVATVPRPARSLHELLALHERVLIIQSLQSCGFSRTLAATKLGVKRTYLWRRMKLLKIDLTALPRTTGGRPRKKYT